MHSGCHAHGARGLAYAAVFMALQTHSVLPPRHLFGWLIVCVREHYERLGWDWGGSCSPLPPAPGFVLPFPAWVCLCARGVSMDTDLNFKPI